jgi:flagellar biosynthesis protein FlhB
MEQNAHDKTEQATPFRREESRQRGEVQRSGDFNTFAVVFGVVAMLLGWGATAWQTIVTVSRQLLVSAALPEGAPLLAVVFHSLLEVVIPFGLAAIAMVVIGSLLQTGPVFSFQPLEPRFERINPIAGFRKLFSKRLLFELVKSLLKVAILGSIAFFLFTAFWPSLLLLGTQPPSGELGYLAAHAATLLTRLVAALLLIGLLDWAYVRWQYGQQLMMSRRDVKDEVKRREGDPHIRARIRELQRENLKQTRSLGNMPDADVLITNPDHVGVALRYVRGEMAAPYIIAKGTGLWLDRMKDLARQHAVPIRQQPPLARQLFRHGALERPIPADTYLEVARLYADLAAERRAAAGRYEVTAR